MLIQTIPILHFYCSSLFLQYSTILTYDHFHNIFIYNIELMENTPIICDPGTGYMKMGFAGDNFPKASFASLVGRPMLRFQESLGEGVQLKEVMIGNEASKYRSLLQLSYPTSEGIVKSWEDMELLLRYSFQQIGVNDPRGASVFLTEAIMNPVTNKVGMMEVMFEKLQVNRIQYGMQALMSLFAEGMETAMLLDSGDGVTHVIPVFDGNIIKSSFERLEIAGRHVTNHLLKLMHQRGYAFNSTSDFQTVREIKQKFCFVSGDIVMDKKMALETTIHERQYKLPDGEVVKIGRQRFLAPEILMNPSIAGMEVDGCGQMVFKSINNCDMNLRKAFYNNILISGGTSMIPGFPSRLKEDVETRFRERILKGAATNTSSIKIRVIDPPTRKYNVFIGSSIIAKETEKYDKAWTYKRQYEQKGKTRLAQELNQKVK